MCLPIQPSNSHSPPPHQGHQTVNNTAQQQASLSQKTIKQIIQEFIKEPSEIKAKQISELTNKETKKIISDEFSSFSLVELKTIKDLFESSRVKPILEQIISIKTLQMGQTKYAEANQTALEKIPSESKEPVHRLNKDTIDLKYKILTNETFDPSNHYYLFEFQDSGYKTRGVGKVQEDVHLVDPETWRTITIDNLVSNQDGTIKQQDLTPQYTQNQICPCGCKRHFKAIKLAELTDTYKKELEKEREKSAQTSQPFSKEESKGSPSQLTDPDSLDRPSLPSISRVLSSETKEEKETTRARFSASGAIKITHTITKTKTTTTYYPPNTSASSSHKNSTPQPEPAPPQRSKAEGKRTAVAPTPQPTKPKKPKFNPANFGQRAASLEEALVLIKSIEEQNPQNLSNPAVHESSTQHQTESKKRKSPEPSTSPVLSTVSEAGASSKTTSKASLERDGAYLLLSLSNAMETSATTTEPNSIHQILENPQEIETIIECCDEEALETLSPNQIKALLFMVENAWVYDSKLNNLKFNQRQSYFSDEDEASTSSVNVINFLSNMHYLETHFNIQNQPAIEISRKLNTGILFVNKITILRLLNFVQEFETMLGFTPNLDFMLETSKRIEPNIVLEKNKTDSTKQTFQDLFASEMIRHIHLLDCDKTSKIKSINTCFDLITDPQLKLTLLTELTPTGLTLYNQALSDGHYILADYLIRLKHFIQTEQMQGGDTTNISPKTCLIYTHNPDNKKLVLTPEPFVWKQTCQHPGCNSTKLIHTTDSLKKHYAEAHLTSYIQFQLACYARFKALPFGNPYTIDVILNMLTSSISYNSESGLHSKFFKSIADFEVCLDAFIDLYPSWSRLNYFKKDNFHYRFEIIEQFRKSQTFQEKLTCLKLLALDPQLIFSRKYPLRYMLEAMDYLDPILHLQKNWKNSKEEQKQLSAALKKTKEFENFKLNSGPKIMKTHIYVAMQLGLYELVNFIICHDKENFKREINTDLFIDMLSVFVSKNQVELIKLIFSEIEEDSKKIKLLEEKDRDGKTLIKIAQSRHDQTLFNFLSTLKIQKKGSSSSAIVIDDDGDEATSSSHAPSNPQVGGPSSAIVIDDDDDEATSSSHAPSNPQVGSASNAIMIDDDAMAIDVNDVDDDAMAIDVDDVDDDAMAIDVDDVDDINASDLLQLLDDLSKQETEEETTLY